MEAITIILVMLSNLHNLLDLFMVISDISTFAFLILSRNVLVNINCLLNAKERNSIKITLH